MTADPIGFIEITSVGATFRPLLRSLDRQHSSRAEDNIESILAARALHHTAKA